MTFGGPNLTLKHELTLNVDIKILFFILTPSALSCPVK